MNIIVVGFGHFAGIVSSCLVERGHAVTQTDEWPHLMGSKRAEDEAEYSPIQAMAGRPLSFVWIAYNSPLDAEGFPVTDEMMNRIARLHERFTPDVPFVISCQWPVGTFAQAEARCPDRALFYVMENVRVGKAMGDFRHQSSIIVGARSSMPDSLQDTLYDFTDRIVLMSPESAEMAKHTTNAFMALQIAFINEIAALSARMQANPEDVATGLRADGRVNESAPLRPGGPFGGGSLMRDLKVLERLTAQCGIDAPILHAILRSNEVKR